MTRSEKLSKLANAIREYRGLYRGSVYIHTPKKGAARRIKTWLDRLGIDTPESWSAIERFSTIDEFSVWLRHIA